MEKVIGKPAFKPLILSSAGMFLDGYSLTIIAFAIILINPYFHLSALGSGLVIGSVVIGSIFGAILIGYTGDLFGRRWVYVANMAVFAVSGFISAVSLNFWMLFVSRLIMGVAVGADYPLSNSYIAEIAPREYRGKYLAFAGVSFGIGSLFSALVSAALFPFGPEMWRIMLGIGIAPAFIVMYLRTTLPESQMWLTARKNKVPEENIISSVNRIYFKGMFSREHLKNTMLYSIIWFLYDIGAYGVGLLIPMIFNQTKAISNVENALITSLILFAGLLSSWGGLLNIDRIGRKGMQIIGLAGMGASLFFIPHFYFNIEGIIILIFFAEIFNSLASLTVGIFPAELSHTSFRSSAYGFSAMMGKIGAICGVLLMAFFVKENKNYGFYIMSLILSIGFILSFFLPETKDRVLN